MSLLYNLSTHILLPSCYQLRNSKSDMYQDERVVLERHSEALTNIVYQSIEVHSDKISLHTLLQTPDSKST